MLNNKFFVFSIFNFFFILFFDLEFLIFNFFFVLFHFRKGLLTIVSDYIYSKKLKLLFFFLLQLISVEIIGYFIEILI